jgi:pimeloyl-ACP methyl ester carboxylesterase
MRVRVKNHRSVQARRIVARLVVYGLAATIGLPMAFCNVLTRTYRTPTATAPADCEESYIPSGELRLRTWTLRCADARKTAVVVHGLGDSLESYLDIGRRLKDRGFTVLLLDLRGHGMSTGDRITLGGHEREDVRAAMGHLRRRGLAGGGFLLVGHSVGAVSVLRAAAVENDVKAVIVEAPFDSYRETVERHARLFFRIPRWTQLPRITVAFAEIWAGFDADDVDAVRAAARIRAPLMAIVDGADRRMPEVVVRRIYDAHPGPKALWTVTGADHMGASLYPEYWSRIDDFLAAHGL